MAADLIHRVYKLHWDLYSLGEGREACPRQAFFQEKRYGKEKKNRN
jgi:hypothetical protein